MKWLQRQLDDPTWQPRLLAAAINHDRVTQRASERGQLWFYVNEYRGEVQKGIVYPTPRWADYQSRLSRPFGWRPLYRVRVIPKICRPAPHHSPEDRR